MVIEVIMPKFEQTMEEGIIVKWFKREGDRVEKGTPLLEVETDKATVEVESIGSGVLRKILAQEGETVPVTQIIALIAEEDEALPEMATQPEVAPRVPAERRVMGAVRIKASPLARKLAKEKKVDLTQVTGTGPGGRVTKRDVLDYLARAKPSVQAFQLIPMSRMRKAIAKQMLSSKTHIPHYYIGAEVDMTEAVRMRENLIPEIESKVGVRLSFTHILIKAVATALVEFPRMNSTYDGENIKVFNDVNMGIAVSLEDGLIVPVLKEANKKSLAQIASEASRLVARAKEKRLSADEYAGGTFTISNLGAFDVETFAAIINPPESAILAVGKITKKPAVIEGKIAVRDLMTMTLSVDHRVIDGALAAQFLQKVKGLLEAPYTLLMP